MESNLPPLKGPRFELGPDDPLFPTALKAIAHPPARLYGIGSAAALQEGIAVVGARKATPYGRSCAKRFATLAAERGIAIISGGARGCDSVAHEAALAAGAPTVAFLGGGCDMLYPAEHFGLFQRIVEGGGAVVSEKPWEFPPMPYAFRERNRLIAGLARATLIVEAGLPSGTFSTADEALAANREVLVVPGSIASKHSAGANRLIYQGATPIVDDETFGDQLLMLFGCLRQEAAPAAATEAGPALAARDGTVRIEAPLTADPLLEALDAEPLGVEQLLCLAREAVPREDALTWLMVWLAKAQRDGMVAQYPDGRYGPALGRRGRRAAAG